MAKGNAAKGGGQETSREEELANEMLIKGFEWDSDRKDVISEIENHGTGSAVGREGVLGPLAEMRPTSIAANTITYNAANSVWAQGLKLSKRGEGT